MAKNKQQKKKERERRVAKKKLAAAQKRAQEKTPQEAQRSVPKTKRVMTSAVVHPTDHVATNKKTLFTQRRGGG